MLYGQRCLVCGVIKFLVFDGLDELCGVKASRVGAFFELFGIELVDVDET